MSGTGQESASRRQARSLTFLPSDPAPLSLYRCQQRYPVRPRLSPGCLPSRSPRVCRIGRAAAATRLPRGAAPARFAPAPATGTRKSWLPTRMNLPGPTRRAVGGSCGRRQGGARTGKPRIPPQKLERDRKVAGRGYWVSPPQHRLFRRRQVRRARPESRGQVQHSAAEKSEEWDGKAAAAGSPPSRRRPARAPETAARDRVGGPLGLRQPSVFFGVLGIFDGGKTCLGLGSRRRRPA